MSRIRTLKPEWLEDERLGAASDAARLLSVALILLADDHGNGRASPVKLGAEVWGYSADLDVPRKAAATLGELRQMGFVSTYSVRGQAYYSIRNWAKHQRIDNAGKPRVPGPHEADPPDGAPVQTPPENPPPTPPAPHPQPDSPRDSANRGVSLLDPDPDPDRRPSDRATPGARREPPTTKALRGLHEAERTAEHAIIATEDALNAIAAGAYSRALHEAQGMYEVRAADREHFVTVGRLAERVAARDAIDLRATLAAWATRYVSERRQRSPKWWAEHVTAWVGASGAVSGVPLDPDRAELARLDAALNAARTRGDHDEVDRVRAEQRALLDRVQRRTA